MFSLSGFIVLPVLREVEERPTVEDIFPPHHLQVDLSAVAFLLSFKLSNASKLNMGPGAVSMVQHGGVRHGHPVCVLVLLAHSHLLAEWLHGSHIATIEQQLLENLSLLKVTLV